jgi:hypothetical protein
LTPCPLSTICSVPSTSWETRCRAPVKLSNVPIIFLLFCTVASLLKAKRSCVYSTGSVLYSNLYIIKHFLEIVTGVCYVSVILILLHPLVLIVLFSTYTVCGVLCIAIFLFPVHFVKYCKPAF